jgi:hypothetical protein
MKNKLFILAAVLCAWACSSPKYTYHFDHYDYNSGKKKAAATDVTTASTTDITTAQPQDTSPLLLPTESLEASSAPATVNDQVLASQIKSMNKSELRQLKKDVKEVVKSLNPKKKQNIQEKQKKAAMDGDLRMALIFGIAALILGAFSGVSTVFWILAIAALVVGIIYLIRYLSRN